MIASYLDKIPENKRNNIRRLRDCVLGILPEADESLHYKMPTYSYKGKNILAFAAQKNYYSVYILDPCVMEKYKAHFEHLSSGKSCIRFKHIDQFPLHIFEQIISDYR